MNFTIHDVAKRAGVSISTVSRVLNNNAGVKDAKTAAVLEAIDYYKYEPNQFGRGLVKQTSNTIGLYFSDFAGLNNTYTIELLQGITQAITENDYNLLLITQKPKTVVPIYYDFIKRKKMDGLIVANNKGPIEDFVKLLNEGYPVAYYGDRVADGGFNINAQYSEYMYKAIKKLCMAGHRNILTYIYKNSLQDFSVSAQRIKEEYTDVAIHVNCDVGKSAQINREQIMNDIDLYIGQKKCTAICVWGIENTHTILNIFSSHGINVPNDVSLIAIEHKKDDFIYPFISTFTVPSFEMGFHAADMLLKHLNGIETEKTYLVPYFFTDRGSIKQI